MPAQPCANHPREMTYVRCARCDTPICVRCMVDTPVGKKCRGCAANRTHVTESDPPQVLRAFGAATLVAVPARWIVEQFAIILLPFLYGYLVGEVALWAGQRRRSRAMQCAAGLAALVGGIVGTGIVLPSGPRGAGGTLPPGSVGMDFAWTALTNPYSMLLTAIGVVVAVWHVRHL